MRAPARASISRVHAKPLRQLALGWVAELGDGLPDGHALREIQVKRATLFLHRKHIWTPIWTLKRQTFRPSQRYYESMNNNVVNEDICVAVATHKPYPMPQDDIYMPLHVGAALHPEICPEMVGDDTGDNISRRNGYYSELTGLYWLWKNNHAAYKGLVHYRRQLGTPNIVKRVFTQDRFARIISGEEVRAILQFNDIIVAKQRNYYIETVYSHYAHTFHAEQFDCCRDVLVDLAPNYVDAWDHLMRSRGAHIFNMFIMSQSKFDAYCAWMFPILFELERRLNPAKYDAFQARYLGRVSERLLDPWLQTNNYAFVELPVISPEPVNWWKKGKGFLMAKFGGKTYDKSF